MTMTNQILNNNIEQNNKKIYFDDLSPIRECLDGRDKCLGYYIFDYNLQIKNSIIFLN